MALMKVPYMHRSLWQRSASSTWLDRASGVLLLVWDDGFWSKQQASRFFMVYLRLVHTGF